MADPTIDPATFAELQASAGEDFTKELVDTFLEEAPTMLRQLRTALAGGLVDDFRRAAHSLKSNSHTFGAVALGAMARDLELKGLDAAGQPGALDALDAEYMRTRAALQALRDG